MAEGYPYFTLGLETDRPSMCAEDIPTLDTRAPGEAMPFEPIKVARKPDTRPRTDYLPSRELSHAVNTALVLGMPLLVTGQPGTGKTELATAIGRELRCPVYKFETKSTSQARDLFYTYDSMSAFKLGEGGDTRNFITYQALGRAILETFDRKRRELATLLPAKDLAGHVQHRSVVLIDEIDKAPRDFPNDLLNEIERLYFRVPELRNESSPMRGDYGDIPANLRPIIVITSNEERGLPPPFLRRCVFFEIPFPEEREMLDIVERRIRGAGFPDSLVREAVALFFALRRQGGADEGPSTAELLNWMQLLGHRGIRGDRSLREQSDLVEQSVAALLKSKEARARGLDYLRDEWKIRTP